MVTSTFYRFYNIWLNSTVFLGLTVSCNALALGFRLGRTSLERFSCCASHFIELVGNKCRLEYHNFCLTKCGSSEKIGRGIDWQRKRAGVSAPDKRETKFICQTELRFSCLIAV